MIPYFAGQFDSIIKAVIKPRERERENKTSLNDFTKKSSLRTISNFYVVIQLKQNHCIWHVLDSQRLIKFYSFVFLLFIYKLTLH